MGGVALLVVLALVLWLVARSERDPRKGSGPGAAEDGEDVTVDDLWLHDEVNPDDSGDVGDSPGKG